MAIWMIAELTPYLSASVLPPQVIQVTLGVYAALLAVGGAAGYVKARSRPSLIAGLACAAFALVCLWLTFDHRPLGTILGMILALALIVFFGRRFYNSRKFMPAGLLTLVSVLVLGILFLVGLLGQIFA